MPTNAKGWDMIGIASGQLGDTDAAIAAGRRAVELAPANPHFHRNYGTSLLNHGMPAEADEQFVLAIRILGEDSADLLYHRALCLHQQDRFPEALPLYERVLELDPGHAQAKQVVDQVTR